jgi:hypothetical protein
VEVLVCFTVCMFLFKFVLSSVVSSHQLRALSDTLLTARVLHLGHPERRGGGGAASTAAHVMDCNS